MVERGFRNSLRSGVRRHGECFRYVRFCLVTVSRLNRSVVTYRISLSLYIVYIEFVNVIF